MKNKIYLTLLSVILLMGLSFNASAENTSLKYEEKYFCEIKTTDEKNYTLDLEWQAEAEKFSTTPAWNEKLIYTLKLDSVQVDHGYFSDFGFGSNKTELIFNYDKYIFVASASQATRLGANYSEATIELSKDYDDDAKVIFKLVIFKSSKFFDRIYDLSKSDQTELSIKSSKCAVTTKSKE